MDKHNLHQKKLQRCEYVCEIERQREGGHWLRERRKETERDRERERKRERI